MTESVSLEFSRRVREAKNPHEVASIIAQLERLVNAERAGATAAPGPVIVVNVAEFSRRIREAQGCPCAIAAVTAEFERAVEAERAGATAVNAR